MPSIIVADDDADIRDLVVFKLQNIGYDVTAVSDGEAALAAARARVPDLFVLDVMMPGLSGLDTCKVVRKDPHLARVPVILLTARAQQSDVDEGYAAGADDYVTKPFSPRELAFRVAALLGGPGV